MFLFVCTFCTIGAYAQPTRFITSADSNIQYFGRIDDANIDEIAFAFPGVSIKANFTGTSITAILSQNGGGGASSTNYFTVIIDEQEPFVLAISPSQNEYNLAHNLPQGVHSVEIFKRTESFVGTVVFKGFYVDAGHSLVAPDALPNTRIEFIGNSITCGYGNESSQNPPKSGFTSVNENNYMAWGAIAARELQAQYSCVAYSGRGLYQNNDGSTAGTLPKIYDQVIADNATVTWDNTRYVPDIIVINLGTNDFSAEAASSAYTVDSALFVDTYIAFVEKLRGYYAHATIICAVGVMMSDSYPENQKHWTRIQSYTSAVVNHFADSGDNHVFFFKMNPQSAPYGEDWHPTIATHDKMARSLVRFIASIDAGISCTGTVNIGEDLNVSEMNFPFTIQTNEEAHIDVTYTWYKNGVKTATSSQPYLTLTDANNAIGQYRVEKDSAHCVYQDKITLHAQNPSEIVTVHNSDDAIRIAFDNAYLCTISSEDEMIQSVELFSILGTSVLKMNNIAQNTVVIDLSTLQGGMYVVKINTQSYVYYKKMLRY